MKTYKWRKQFFLERDAQLDFSVEEEGCRWILEHYQEVELLEIVGPNC